MEEEEEKAPTEETKKPRGKLVFILVAVALTAAAGVGGVFFGPRLLGKAAAAPAPSASAPTDPPVTSTAQMSPIVVDVMADDGTMHHLKVVLSFELDDSVKEEDFKHYSPRGREAAVAYLRSQTFEHVTEPKRFPEISKKLSEVTTKAIGEKRIRRVLVTDYVAQ
ncbi:MAG: flagellar basal body-associated FliL family protein [Myxococcales bacterium]|nr:flagellar basal body-associated FliL family protein [Myxococcales bacterium]MCB9579332.1 flagellar basal body-associated FliL family protein [Polyangiaceae bacterium]